jgi:hypothetical protein
LHWTGSNSGHVRRQCGRLAYGEAKWDLQVSCGSSRELERVPVSLSLLSMARKAAEETEMHSLMTLVINAVPSIGVSGAHHLFWLLPAPLSFGTAHFAFLALRLPTSFQVCDKVSLRRSRSCLLGSAPCTFLLCTNPGTKGTFATDRLDHRPVGPPGRHPSCRSPPA